VAMTLLNILLLFVFDDQELKLDSEGKILPAKTKNMLISRCFKVKDEK
jgi:hypothetical protein